MKISIEFSKHAKDYNDYNIIQNKVIKKLLSGINSKPKNILDLGCGNGNLCNEINWKYNHFTGVDFAPGMLELHPKSKKIEAIYGDFNDKTLFDNLLTYQYDYIVSASALQWAENLDKVLKNIQKLNAPIAFAIFTENTFKTVFETANISPLLRSKDKVQELVKKYFKVKIEVVKYELKFNSTHQMFRYIKQSGISGRRNLLTYKQTKNLIKNYPLKYLEFEVLFIST